MSSQLHRPRHEWPTLTERPAVERATRIFNLWSAESTPFYVFVLRPAPNAEIQRMQDAFREVGVGAVISPDFLHITVQSLGNIGDGGLTGAIAEELADAVAATLTDVAPFPVALHGANSFWSAAVIEVHESEPSFPLARTQRAIVDALLAADLVPVRHPERPYVPHLSVCYYDDTWPSQIVAQAIAPYRKWAFGDLWVDTIELVRIAGDGSLYPPMETVRTIVLGSAT